MRSLRSPALALPLAVVCASACAGNDAGDAAAEMDSSASEDGSADDDTGDAEQDDSGGMDTAADEGTDESGGTGVEPPTPGEDTTVVAFDDAHVYFGEENHRTIDVDVTFPDGALAYESITLELGLGCPDGFCDAWDRKGSLGIVENAGTEEERVLEVARYMTPYGVGGTWTIDVSYLRPLLAGDVTMRVFIDTWVGPGHSSGNGWLVDATFEMKGGLPDRLPTAAIPLWPEMSFVVGDPETPVTESVPAVSAEIGADTTSAEIVSLITGHGQGNAMNCAEFCPMNHGFMVGNTPVQRLVWRDDCAQNPINNQGGNWTPSRAGWCPGADVLAWREDVSAALTPGETVTVEYAVQDYENTCRPNAPTCTGCTLGTGCEYDGGAHTPPHYQFSALLVTYRDLP